MPQAPITKASLTEMQAIASTPLAFSASKFSTKPGTCLAEQVGVKAPGSANSATVLPAKKLSVLTGRGLAVLHFHQGGAGNFVADFDRHSESLLVEPNIGGSAAAVL